MAAELESTTPAAAGMDRAKLEQARDYALTGEGSGQILRGGKVVMDWGDQAALYDLKSSSKAIGVTLLGIALKDGKVKLDDKAATHHPQFGVPPDENAATGWPAQITLRQLANQTAGFEKVGGYGKLQFPPGSAWFYSDAGPNWLAECLSHVYRRDLNDLMFERVFTPIGIHKEDIRWRKHAYRPELIEGVKRREFGSGFSSNVRAMARIGLLYLRDGWWSGEQILFHDFIEQVRRPGPEMKRLPTHGTDPHGADSAAHYGLLWWNNADGSLPGVPRDAYWSWGLFDSLIVVIPSLDIVAARAGKSWKRQPDAHPYDVLKPFLEPIAAAVVGGVKSAPAVPESPVIAGIEWAPLDSIVRMAKGSDNWPMTWADDDTLYTAYGDGRGFEPFVPRKLSLGLARVTGPPQSPVGANLNAPTAEATGDGKKGPKASGMLMVQGVLYLWTRNAGNSRVGWSADHGATWTWAGWKFTESFGCPSFINFGRNYAGARDEYVYVHSHDQDSAYERADRMVLARVPKDRIREQGAYEFFAGLDAAGRPAWSIESARRAAIFTDPGNCYRSHMSHHPGLKRYLWCQTGRGHDTRFAGGFAIYDAPEPWGPWTLAFSTPQWDTGPGESCILPVKWMGKDDLSLHLVFSGDDCFSVRRGTLRLKAAKPLNQ